MIDEILKTIRLLFDTCRFGAETALKKAKRPAQYYIKGLIVLALVSIFPPFLLLIIGILCGWNWLTALTGLWWAFCSFLLLLAVSPIGLLIETLTSGVKGSGQRYIKRASNIFLGGLCVSLFASLIPVKTNISMLPLLILSAIIPAVLNVWFFKRKIIAPIVSVIFIAIILSFFFPSGFESIKEKVGNMDMSMVEPERISITYEDIKDQKIKFFQPNGEPKVWYYKGENGWIEIYNRKGFHPIYKVMLKPVTGDIALQIEKQYKYEEQRKSEELLIKERQHREEEKRREDQRAAQEREALLKKQEEARKLEEQRKAQEHEARLNRYITSRSVSNQHEITDVAIIVVNENNSIDYQTANRLSLQLKSNGFNVYPSFFTQAFVDDGMFERIFRGDAGKTAELELATFVDSIFMGKKEVSFKNNSDLQDIITTRINVEVNIISAESGMVKDSFLTSEIGAGFSKNNAEEEVMERVQKTLLENALNGLK